MSHVAFCSSRVSISLHAVNGTPHVVNRTLRAARRILPRAACIAHRARPAGRGARAARCTRAVNRRHHTEGCCWIAGRWNGCARDASPCKRRRAGAPARSLGRAADAPHGRRRHGRGEDGAATRLANAEAFSNQRGIASGAAAAGPAEAFRAAVSRSLTTHGYPQWHNSIQPQWHDVHISQRSQNTGHIFTLYFIAFLGRTCGPEVASVLKK
jgi:hypothetical protein